MAPNTASRQSSPRSTRSEERGRSSATSVSPRHAPAERASVRRSDERPEEGVTFATVPLIPNSVAAARTITYPAIGLGDAKRRRQLRARRDLELAVDARQMHLPRLRRHEERLRDVLVRHVLRGHLGDAPLAWRQRIDARQHQPARTRTGGGELGLRTLLERGGTELVRELETLAQELARVGALVRAAQRGTELDERTCVLEPGLRRLEHLDGLAQHLLPGHAALDQPERAQRDADGLRRAPDAGPVDRVERDGQRFAPPPREVQREREIRAPVVDQAVLEPDRRQVLTERPQLGDRVLMPVLREPELRARHLEEGEVAVRRDPSREPAVAHEFLRAVELAALDRELGLERKAVHAHGLPRHQLEEARDVGVRCVEV